jgi:hypothetical protein
MRDICKRSQCAINNGNAAPRTGESLMMAYYTADDAYGDNEADQITISGIIADYLVNLVPLGW